MTYFEKIDEQSDRLAVQVDLLASVELLPDVLHVLAVAGLPEDALGGRASLPQQHQQLLDRGRGQVRSLQCTRKTEKKKKGRPCG